MMPHEKAKDMVAVFMEYTPDYFVESNQAAYIICVSHAIIFAKYMIEVSFSKSYWADVLDCLKEMSNELPLDIKA